MDYAQVRLISLSIMAVASALLAINRGTEPVGIVNEPGITGSEPKLGSSYREDQMGVGISLGIAERCPRAVIG